MKIKFAGLLCLLTCRLWSADIGLELLPRGDRPFRLTFADPREIRMSLGFEGDSQINAAIGNYFSIFEIRPHEVNEAGAEIPSSWNLHFGLEGAGFFTMRQAESRFPLETADGLIGAYVEGRSSDWIWQLRYTHVSAHLADGSVGNAIPFSRETLILRAGWVPLPTAQVYVGFHYLANSIPTVRPLGLQWGGNYFFLMGNTKVVPFVAADFKLRQESPSNPSINLQGGIALNNPPEAYRSFRLFYAYYTGSDPRGQFYTRGVTAHSLGVEMQI